MGPTGGRHDLAFIPRESVISSSEGDATAHSTMTDERSCLGPCLGGTAGIGAFCL